MKRWVLIGLIIAVVCAGGYVWLGNKKDEGWVSYPTQVAVLPAMEVVSAKKMTGIGSVEAKHQVMVSSEVSGQITEIHFNSGDWVQKGDVLIQLNDDIERAEKMRLLAQRELAVQQLKRFTTLAEQKAGSREQLDKSEAELKMVESEIHKVDALIEQKKIVAPFEGRVGIRRVHLGEFIVNGQAIVSLINDDELFANFTLDDKTLSHLSVGQHVVIHNGDPNREYDAVITSIDPWIDQSGLLAIQADILDSKTHLTSGMYIKAELESPLKSKVVIIPETGIAYSAYGHSVFIVSKEDPSKVERRRVTIGDRIGAWVEVIEGIDVGDQVVISGQHKLENNSLIEIVESDTLQFTLPKDQRKTED
ncbi:efflux RND transporter periplasmic adaptor subunit [Wohlfahrtiimonas larvae]|uniref:Multidrug efflux RND transporter periplasmic adaptor MexH n=1 Tax=Wohlfahrtiimonas larvae TaxID=1157986 RepID=A0ABP9MWT5_9GAMM|nr:efflux RND transporter periplasmic adaptor subunit [Wohlfahrtiimonas larvae]